MNVLQCPAPEELSAFALGKLGDDDIERLSTHVEACMACQSRLQALDSASDLLLAELRNPELQKPPAIPEPCRQALARAATYCDGSAAGAATAGDAQVAPLGRIREYQLLEKLGQGGMGTVYKALHVKLKRLAALKVLPAERLRDPRAIARFQREMEAVGNLVHPNIVLAHDAGEADGDHFLVMEYVDGLDLAHLADCGQPLAIADACEMVRQAALGLDHAHRHGLIHRDVKPSNLMLSSEGLVKVLDLGLALLDTPETAAEGLTEECQVMGTPDYMAPEQAGDSHAVDSRADIYSLGCTLYMLLAGRPPFAGPQYPTALKKLMAHAQAAPMPLRDSRADVPESLAAIAAQMMAKQPAKRPASCQEVAVALAPFAAGNDLPRLLAHVRDRAAPAIPSPATSADTASGERSALHQTDPIIAPGAAKPGVEAADRTIKPEQSPASASPLLNAAGGRRVRTPRQRRWLAAGAAATVVLAGVIVIIRNKAGEETRIPLQHGESVTVINENDPQEKVDPEQSAPEPSNKPHHETPSESETKPESKPASPSRDRQVAEEVLQNGGQIAWIRGAAAGSASQISDVPSHSFKVSSIRLTGPHELKADLFKRVGQLGHLVALQAEGAPITDREIEQLGNLQSLQVLDLHDVKVTEESLTTIAGLKRLRSLSLRGVTLSDRAAALIGSLRGLEQLSLVNAQLTNEAVQHVATLRNLWFLNLNGNKLLTDEGLRPLGALLNLEDLRLNNARLNGSGFMHLANLSRLHTLSVRECRIHDENLRHLKGLSRLRRLDLAYTNITDRAVAPLSEMSSLTQLYIDNTRMTDAGGAKLASALPLSNLSPSHADATREAARWIFDKGGEIRLGNEINAGPHIKNASDLPTARFEIQEATFPMAATIDDDGCRRLAQLSNLVFLSINGAEITDRGFRQLASLKRLWGLQADRVPISEDAFAALAGCEELRSLSLNGVQVGRAGVPAFKALRLEHLHLPNSLASDNLLATVPIERLTSLSLQNCTGVTDEGLKHLAGAKKLESVDLTGTSISDAGLEHLASLTGIRTLILGNTPISSAGLQRLAGLTRLEVLHLYGTSVGDESLEMLAALSNLDELALQNTVVTEASVARLQKLLPDCNIVSDAAPTPAAAKDSKTPISTTSPPVAAEDIDRTVAEQVLARGGGVQVCIAGAGGATHGLSPGDALPARRFYVKAIFLGRSAEPTDVLFKHIGALRHIRLLEAAYNSVADDDLSHIAGLQMLEVLGLNATRVTDAGMLNIRSLKQLSSLSLGFTQVSDQGLQAVADLEGLEALYLNGTRVTNAGLPALAGLKRLRSLMLDVGWVTDDGLKHLSALPQLRILSLAGAKVRGPGLKEIASLPSLEQLTLDSDLRDESLEPLSRAQTLHTLNITSPNLTDDCAKYLKAIPNLRILNLECPRLTDEGGKLLTEALPRSNLNPQHVDEMRATANWVLEMGGTVWVDSFNKVGKPSELPQKPLGISGASMSGVTQFADADLERLCAAADLGGFSLFDGLSLDGTAVTDRGLGALRSQRRIQSLELRSTAITDDGLAHLVKCRQLRRIALDGTNVTARGISHLKALSLHDFDAFGCPLDDAALAELKDVRTLAVIRISNAPQITDQGPKSIAGLTNLVTLVLRGTSVTDAGLVHLSGLARLHDLNLDGTIVSGEGLQHIGKLSELETLSLAGTSLSDRSLAALAGLDRLWLLDLSSTPISDAGLEHLAKLTSLGEVRLSGTRVTKQGVARLQTALPTTLIVSVFDTGIP